MMADSICKPLRVLIVEDDELGRELCKELLAEADIEAETVGSGRECLDMITKKEAGYYNLIFMDLNMPIMDGLETTRLIRKLDDEKKAKLPIIALTGSIFSEDKIKAREAGMNGYLTKPFDIEDIKNLLNKSVGIFGY